MPKSAMGPPDSNPPMETHWMAEDPECGVFAQGPRSHVITMIASHFIANHPGINPIVDGEHYRLYEAPNRCDVCSMVLEPPIWVHTTPDPINTVFSVDVDSEWLLCTECHDIVVKRDAVRLAIRMIKVHEQLSPGLLAGPVGVNLRVHFTEMAHVYVETFDDGRLDD